MPHASVQRIAMFSGPAALSAQGRSKLLTSTPLSKPEELNPFFSLASPIRIWHSQWLFQYDNCAKHTRKNNLILKNKQLAIKEPRKTLGSVLLIA